MLLSEVEAVFETSQFRRKCDLAKEAVRVAREFDGLAFGSYVHTHLLLGQHLDFPVLKLWFKRASDAEGFRLAWEHDRQEPACFSQNANVGAFYFVREMLKVHVFVFYELPAFDFHINLLVTDGEHLELERGVGLDFEPLEHEFTVESVVRDVRERRARPLPRLVRLLREQMQEQDEDEDWQDDARWMLINVALAGWTIPQSNLLESNWLDERLPMIFGFVE